jgi:hypothetical protein
MRLGDFMFRTVLLVYWRSYFWRSCMIYIFLASVSTATSDLHFVHFTCACPFSSINFRLQLGHRTSSKISTASFLRFYRFKIATASVVCFLWNLG